MRRTLVALLALACAHAQADQRVVERWDARGIASDQFESHPAFDPRNGDLYFVRSTPKFEGWYLLTSRCGPQGWTAPEKPPFAAAGLEADPWFTPDGKTLYFISNRATDGIARKDLDIWKVTRDEKGAWGTPERLPAPVNSTSQEWYPRLAADGWLYFGSARPGGIGKTDIWRAREEGTGHWTVENAGPGINTAGDEYEALPSPDGKMLYVMAADGLYRSRWTGQAWGAKEKLPPEVNVNGSEVGALLSPSGRSLMFARDTRGPLSGELFVWHMDGHEDWPVRCPRK